MEPIDKAKLLDVNQAARYLLGCEIWRTLENGHVIKAKIVETESYHEEDPASHTFNGQSERNRAMFGEAGHAYIYFTYGMHWCFNVTAGKEGYGAGVLIRACEPIKGLDFMQVNRGVGDLKNLTNGPAKLARALAIDKSLYGHDLTKPPLQIYEPINKDFQIVETTRIGVNKGVEEIARFYIKHSEYVSKI